MSRILFKSALVAVGFFSLANVSAKSPAEHVSPKVAHYSNCLYKSSFVFTPNEGQVADINGHARPDVLFTAMSGNLKMFLTANSISYQFTKVSALGKADNPTDEVKSIYRFSVGLNGANANPEIIREEKAKRTENFYWSNCPQGVTNVATYSRLVYQDVYPGINWVVYGKGNRMEYDFEVKAGADPSAIRLKIKDAGSVNITDDGSLVINTPLGQVVQNAPKSYINGRSVVSHFRKYADGSIGFAVARPKSSETLVIDPSVEWATYYGGILNEQANYVTVSDSSVYLIGRTASTSGISSVGAFQTIYGGGNDDAMIVKFDTLGNLVWATYYGGTASADFGYACAVDTGGYLYFAGLGQSAGLGTVGTYSATNAGSVDAILVKFNSVTGARIWGTYFGAYGNDQGISCTLHGDRVYLAGVTNSTVGIASPGAFQDTLGRNPTSTVTPTYDAFLAAFDTTGNRQWSTYYGGSNAEGNVTVQTDGDGNVYMCGFTESNAGISAPGAFQPSFGGYYDDFLVKFDSLGNRIWATYYGGGGNDQVGVSSGMIISGSNIYLAGQSSSTSSFATAGSYESTNNGGIDAYLARFDTSGNRLWCTYYGGTLSDFGQSCALDGYGGVYLVGYTASTAGIASATAFQGTYGGGLYDGFVSKFDTLGNFMWGSYIGGNDTDYLFSCASDQAGHLYLGGYSKSTSGLATTGSFQDTTAGGYDAFLVRILDIPTTAVPNTVIANKEILGQNYPNPFSVNTTIPFSTQGGIITLELFDINGRFIKTLVQGTYKAGTYNVQVNNDDLSAGNYLYKITNGSRHATKQMTLMSK